MTEQAEPDPDKTAHFSFSARIDEQSAGRLLAACTSAVEQGAECLYIALSQIGGDVSQAINAYHVLTSLGCTVITHNLSLVESAGNILFLAGKPRYAVPQAFFRFHGAFFRLSEYVEVDEHKMHALSVMLKLQNFSQKSVVKQRTRITDDAELDAMFSRETIFDGEAALAKGIVDRVREFRIPKGASIRHLL